MKGGRSVNVVFTGAGRRVELLRAFRGAFAELGVGGRIVALDVDPLAPSLRVADRSYLVPPFDDPNYIPTLAEIATREEAHLIFPLTDLDIVLLASRREELEATGARVVVVSKEAAEIASDKWLTYKFFREVGVPTPQTWLADEVAGAHIDYPVIVKPRWGSGGKHVFKARNWYELEFFLKYVPNPLVQAYVEGSEITTDVVADYQGRVLAIVSRRRIEVRSGEVSKGVTVYDPLIVEHTMRISEHLGVVGPINIQCIVHGGIPYFTEINARFGGGYPLSIAAGVPSHRWLIALAAGIPFEVPPLGTYQVGVYLSRFDDSFYFTQEDYAKVPGNHL